jgi:hypothetical protein
MIINFVVPALFLVAASTSASAAQTDSRTAAAKPAAAAGAKGNKICIKVAPMTGSRFEKLECKTREDWARDGVDIDEMLK